ncbi:hypothetical protein [Azospirillum endophyticum]
MQLPAQVPVRPHIGQSARQGRGCRLRNGGTLQRRYRPIRLAKLALPAKPRRCGDEPERRIATPHPQRGREALDGCVSQALIERHLPQRQMRPAEARDESRQIAEEGAGLLLMPAL